MANTGSLLADAQGWAAAPTLPRALGAALFLVVAAVMTHFMRSLVPAPSGLFLFFIAVLLAAVRFGFWIGIGSAAAAFAVFNFLFVAPLYTFAIAKPGDLMVLAEFLAVAGLTGFLAGRLREEADAATSRATLLEGLSGFAADLTGAGDAGAIEGALLQHATLLALGPALMLHADGDDLNPDPALDATDLQAAARALRRKVPQDSARPGQQGGRFAFIPLVQAGQVVAVLGYPRLAEGLPDRTARTQAIEVICHQANLALERLGLANAAEDARTRATRESLRAALLTSLSHDLRTPLATILGAITSLRQLGETLPPAARDDLALAIEEEARRLSHYVDNLLQMTRLQAGLELHLAWVDPADVVHAAVARAIRAFPAARIKVEVPDLPMLRIESALLEQCLFNLLDNAVKFSPAGGLITVVGTVAAGHVAADLAAADHVAADHVAADHVTLTVTDLGPGIATSALAEIFNPFYRTDRQRPGTGLGLTICAGFVQALAGRLAAISPVKDGRGTAMCITLPVPQPEPVPES